MLPLEPTLEMFDCGFLFVRQFIASNEVSNFNMEALPRIRWSPATDVRLMMTRSLAEYEGFPDPLDPRHFFTIAREKSQHVICGKRDVTIVGNRVFGGARLKVDTL